jgi:hypothetical protein
MVDKYTDMALRALDGKVSKKLNLNESRMTYEDGHDERINSHLATQLRNRETSLGNHPIFPESDESHFEEKLMSSRFTDVVKNFKRHHGTDEIDLNKFYAEQHALMLGLVELEKKHTKKLQEIAINLVREEFDVTEDDVEIMANLTTEFTIEKNEQIITPKDDLKVEFDNHVELTNANAEVYKRRFVNALIQGSAKKVNHMFHMVDEELQDMEPLLPSGYSKLMSGADYAYLLENDGKSRMIGGSVQVEFPKKEGERPRIIAEAVLLPVLIHEIVKGVMEILASHGIPQKPEIAEYVMNKADYMNAETWDMRLGPPIWEKFIESIPPEDFPLKHYIFVELVGLPVEEFNSVMREIMMGSRTGKAKVLELIEEIKDDLRNDEFDNAMEQVSDDEFFNPEDLDNIDDEDWFM